MASVTEMKDERRDHRKRVTIAARRLNGSIDRSQPDEMIYKSASDLEEAYYAFLSIQEDYEELVNSNPDYADHGTVNGLTCQQYLETVTAVYESANSKFKDHVRRLKEEASERNSRPILVQIDYLRNMTRETMKSIGDIIDSGDVYSAHNVSKLQLLKGQIDQLASKLMLQQDKLYAVQDPEKVREVLDDIDSLTRQADKDKILIDSIVLRAEEEERSNIKSEQLAGEAASYMQQINF